MKKIKQYLLKRKYMLHVRTNSKIVFMKKKIIIRMLYFVLLIAKDQMEYGFLEKKWILMKLILILETILK
jgi:hypothetical protein